MFEILDHSKESLHLLLRGNRRKSPFHLPFGNSKTFPIPLERRLIEKLQRPIGLSNCCLTNVSLLVEIMKVTLESPGPPIPHEIDESKGQTS